MINKYKIKIAVIIISIVVVIGSVVFNIFNKKEEVVIPIDDTLVPVVTEEQKTFNLCYYNSAKTDRGFYDVSWLKLNIKGEKVTGEFQNLPAEKDSKVGSFEGYVGPLIPEAMGREANVWWKAQAEGISALEELIIKFGDGSATVGFGEMVEAGFDSWGGRVYKYKDKTKLTYIDSMSQIDCETLDERLVVEKYIRENIKTIATNKPVLGGSWYVISVFVAPIPGSGEVVYQDGHIQSKASFTYTYNKETQSVTVTKFKVES